LSLSPNNDKDNTDEGNRPAHQPIYAIPYAHQRHVQEPSDFNTVRFDNRQKERPFARIEPYRYKPDQELAAMYLNEKHALKKQSTAMDHTENVEEVYVQSVMKNNSDNDETVRASETMTPS